MRFIRKILCIFGFHNWDYLTRTNYKYRGPCREFFRKCKIKGCKYSKKYEEYIPWHHEEYKILRKSKIISDISTN